MAIELSGGSPDRGIRYRPVVNGNCVFARKGGEQPKTNEQSVTKVNSIRPNLSGSLLAKGEPLTRFIYCIDSRWASGLHGD